MHQLLFISLCLSFCCCILGASVTPPCSFVYRGFAKCLVALGDSVSSYSSNDDDVNGICRSWDAFQLCVNSVLSNCHRNATEVWESLKDQSRQTQLPGNLYEICTSHTQKSPQTPSSTDQTNQVSLKAFYADNNHTHIVQMLLTCTLVFLLQ
ncbi:neuritin 1-like b [Trichomycterus rosablanca]|uniref:neuritin 1-like b n=1 Tax=Trichomycterus rosablanca TaxID=2290929 RepID=UPI002F35D9F0